MSAATKGTILAALSVVSVAAFLLLALPHLSPAEGGEGPGARASEPPPTGAARERAARTAGLQEAPPPPTAPADDAMKLTVPALARVSEVPVTTAPGTDERPLRDGALHVEGTGYPWQRGANTYVAGHRLGFPGTGSNLLFWDLDELDSGDKVLLEDAEGRSYEYRVFRKRIVGPEDVSVAAPVPGKSVVSLQTCTLPDYSQRLVVQAEMVGSPGAPDGEDRPADDPAFGVAE